MQKAVSDAKKQRPERTKRAQSGQADEEKMRAGTYLVDELHRVSQVPLNVFAPPAAVWSTLPTILCHTLNNDEPTWTHRQDVIS